MPLFVCDKCGCLENTATGFYWARRILKWKDESLNGKALCSACAPTHYADGTPSRFGEWHGEFERVYYKDIPKEELKNYQLVNH